LLREDKQETLTLTPETCPAGYAHGVPGLPIPMPGNPDWERIRKWIEEMRAGQQGKPGKPGHGGLNFSFVRPGIILRGGTAVESALPDDMTVTISKTGKEPAKVTVKQGEETWETTEKELDKLPEQARSYAEGLLSRSSGVSVRVIGEPKKTPLAGAASAATAADSTKDERIEEMSQRIEELGKLLEGLKHSGPRYQAGPQLQHEMASPQNAEDTKDHHSPNTQEHNEKAPPKEL
jgi:hypothetical protein